MSHIPHDFVEQLRKDLLMSRKARDALAVDVLLVLLNSIDNASAVSVSGNEATTEVPRREVSLQDITDIITAEIIEMQAAAKQLAGINDLRKDELDKKIALLESYLRHTE